MFTVRDRQGRVVAFSGRQLVEQKNSGKYVNSPETVIFKKSNVLFGFDRASRAIGKDPHCEVIVCEGQIDCIRLHSCGFANAVAGQGTAFTEEHVRMLKRVASQAVLVYDDDAAGHKATVRSARMLLAAEIPVRVVSLPDGDDPDSFLRTKGADAFRALLGKGESIIEFQCRTDQAKEANPKSIDAVARVSKSVLATIATCPSPVLRASMVGEAAQLLGLPSAALSEELAKTKVAPRPAAANADVERRMSDDDSRQPADGDPRPADDAAAVPKGVEASVAAPPPEREMAFMQFLLANERDAALDGMAGEFLPREVFAHEFTWRFLETWRMEVSNFRREPFRRRARVVRQGVRGGGEDAVERAERDGHTAGLRPRTLGGAPQARPRRSAGEGRPGVGPPPDAHLDGPEAPAPVALGCRKGHDPRLPTQPAVTTPDRPSRSGGPPGEGDSHRRRNLW